ncbi:hypothetical protein THASP1DRAFT_31451 [Thamnocephalis sphaerospora]|uniref:Uncharacterized protein n=1 Tax=Thamnocephalis sphaerospora TaxID=78915 RepID=A0A4P9XLN3_9FUNG|nr:hypothetical protein THASP1DRAFT_31451 [Thamnocephalis sphaerospora]|eukprot:RKP06735.1 hypothetical protein THASP1DRAFT_31451 [Thamnocephalis sphaerospora]
MSNYYDIMLGSMRCFHWDLKQGPLRQHVANIRTFINDLERHMNEFQLIDEFLAGLPPSYHRRIDARRPRSLEKAIEYAYELEAADRAKHAARHAKKSTPPTRSDNRPLPSSSAYEGKQTAIPTCPICHERGHLRFQCSELHRQRSSPQPSSSQQPAPQRPASQRPAPQQPLSQGGPSQTKNRTPDRANAGGPHFKQSSLDDIASAFGFESDQLLQLLNTVSMMQKKPTPSAVAEKDTESKVAPREEKEKEESTGPDYSSKDVVYVSCLSLVRGSPETYGDQMLTVRASIGGHELEFLVSNGAEVNFLDTQAAKRLKLRLRGSGTAPLIETISGDPEPAVGFANGVLTKYSTFESKEDYVVTHIGRYGGIFSLAWLAKHGAVVDISNKCILFSVNSKDESASVSAPSSPATEASAYVSSPEMPVLELPTMTMVMEAPPKPRKRRSRKSKSASKQS